MKVSITPYKELHQGTESIHDYLDGTCKVPERVIAYLQRGNAGMVTMGVYEHPFIPGKRLLGPYRMTDGHYVWDRDTWKYVVKYGLTLPQDFIDHVMSDEGLQFLNRTSEEEQSWEDWIKDLKQREGVICFMPDNAGNIDIENF